MEDWDPDLQREDFPAELQALLVDDVAELVPSQGPSVSWSSSGGTATVSGPGLSSSSASGSQVVCPNPGWCFGGSGSYTYTVTVTGPGGTTQDSVTVTVG